MPSYLEQKYRTWYATLDIPKAVRDQFPSDRTGKPLRRFFKSLETDSRAVAERRVVPVVAGWKHRIAQAKKALTVPTGKLDFEARSWREQLLDAKDDEEREAILDTIAELARDRIYQNAPAGEIGRPGETLWDDLPGQEGAERFHGIATGAIVDTAEEAEKYISGLHKVAPKSKEDRATSLRLLAKEFPTIGLVTRKGVQRWAASFAGPPHGRDGKGLRVATIERRLTDCRMFWKYLQLHELADDGLLPFDGLDLSSARAAQRRDCPGSALVRQNGVIE